MPSKNRNFRRYLELSEQTRLLLLVPISMYKLVQIVAHKEGKKLGELTRDSLRRYIEVSTGKSYSSLVKKLEKMEALGQG